MDTLHCFAPPPKQSTRGISRSTSTQSRQVSSTRILMHREARERVPMPGVFALDAILTTLLCKASSKSLCTRNLATDFAFYCTINEQKTKNSVTARPKLPLHIGTCGTTPKPSCKQRPWEIEKVLFSSSFFFISSESI